MISLTQPITQRRIEAAVVMLSAIFIYRTLGGSWGQLALLFFIPDLSIFAYLKGPKFGAVVYNTLHSFTWPILLGLYGYLAGSHSMELIALIWIAHCAFDRAIGWGLKFSGSFCNTDMGQKKLPVPNKYLA